MPPRRRQPQEPEAVQQARAARLPEHCAQLSAALRGKFTTDAGKVEQPGGDLLEAYTQARGLAAHFEARLAAADWPNNAVAQTRPSKVKSLERMVEKYLYSKKALVVPLDILGAKVVVGSLWEMYDVASRVEQVFPVVGYRDRVVRPQTSGYRDLQFVLNVGTNAAPHYAELKVMHRLIDELDGYEHKLYEIRRGLQAKETQQLVSPQLGTGWGEAPWGGSPFGAPVLTPIEQLVLDTLERTSANLFQSAWEMVLAADHLPPQPPAGGTP